MLSTFFVLEAFIKIMGFGKRYFFDRWNVLDFVLVCLSFLVFLMNRFNVVNAAY